MDVRVAGVRRRLVEPPGDGGVCRAVVGGHLVECGGALGVCKATGVERLCRGTRKQVEGTTDHRRHRDYGGRDGVVAAGGVHDAGLCRRRPGGG